MSLSPQLPSEKNKQTLKSHRTNTAGMHPHKRNTILNYVMFWPTIQMFRKILVWGQTYLPTSALGAHCMCKLMKKKLCIYAAMNKSIKCTGTKWANSKQSSCFWREAAASWWERCLKHKTSLPFFRISFPQRTLKFSFICKLRLFRTAGALAAFPSPLELH